ncbi:MAG: response regulator [Burkholderiales bacterium]|nr:response regulator [Burkholderiales bacterium]MDE1927348.1 response regulator [Burkholderiales bacterium]MDE2503162.1 response regulator [Burkholderiales bacterium]
MQQLDREVVRSSALVIDGNATSRSVTLQHLRDFGFGHVKSAGRVIDGRELLEHRHYDLVLCEYDFEGGKESGQDLLEELRRERMLPHSTVFIMITGDATYQRVTEAAEAALDSYLIKPYSANTLFERVKEARQRKRVLKAIFDALESRDMERAAALCQERFEQRELYWLYAARIGAEVLLDLKRHDEAKQLFDAVVAAKAVPWARLGVARSQLADGEVMQARRTLESLIGDQPQYADSYDVMGKVQMEQGNLEEARATYRVAASITPGCILRMQHCGTLSFYAGDAPVATQMLERTWSMGNKSRLFDVLSMMLLAFLRFDAQDTKGLALAQDVLQRFADTYDQSTRLRRMAAIGQVLVTLNDGQTAAGVLRAREFTEEIVEPDFDMEAGANILSLWSRLDRYGVLDDELEGVVRRVAHRFAVNKASSEVLAAAVRNHARAQDWIRASYAEVMKVAEDAMNNALRGQAKAAVEQLLNHGRETGNAKLIEMASLVGQRHRERIDGIDALLNAAGALAHRYCRPASHIAGVRRSNRSAGGLVLRR